MSEYKPREIYYKLEVTKKMIEELNKKEVIVETSKNPSDYNNQDICKNCGHLYLFHISNFKGECDACDDPTIPINKKCIGFQKGEK